MGSPRGSRQDEESKAISRQIGQMNASGDLAERISYVEVQAPLQRCSFVVAMKILQDLVANAHNVQNPTNYILAAAKNALGQNGAGRANGAAKWERKAKPKTIGEKLDQPLDALCD